MWQYIKALNCETRKMLNTCDHTLLVNYFVSIQSKHTKITVQEVLIILKKAVWPDHEDESCASRVWSELTGLY